jgi:hypothetical protein
MFMLTAAVVLTVSNLGGAATTRATGSTGGTTTIKVSSTSAWSASVPVTRGEKLMLTATGEINYCAGQARCRATPNGSLVGESICGTPPNCGALIGRFNEGTPFLVGESKELVAEAAGELRLGVNDQPGYYSDNQGAFTVTIKTTTTTTTKPVTTLTGAAYALMKKFMTRYDKAGFSKVTDLGAIGIYRSTLASLKIVIDPKLKPFAKYDPNSNTIVLSRDPRSLKPSEEDAFGQTLWHELTHAIEDTHGDIGMFDSPLYAERNIEYMTHVVGDLQTLAKMEDHAKRGASVATLRAWWNLYLKQMSRANRLPETLKYPPSLKLLRTWFGFKANPAAIRKFYLSGKALPGRAGANLRKALLRARR